MDVELLSEAEAVELHAKHRADLQNNPADADSLRQVVDTSATTHSPFALAGAYLAERGNVTPAKLLDRLNATQIGQPDGPLEQVDAAAEVGTGYRRGVAECLSLHFA